MAETPRSDSTLNKYLGKYLGTYIRPLRFAFMLAYGLLAIVLVSWVVPRFGSGKTQVLGLGIAHADAPSNCDIVTSDSDPGDGGGVDGGSGCDAGADAGGGCDASK